jgi:hypothetical protein
MAIRNLPELAAQVANDTNLAARLRADPQAVTAELAAGAVPDNAVYRMVVGALGAVIVIAAIGSIVLGFAGKETPEVLLSLGSAAVGALAGLLAPSPR